MLGFWIFEFFQRIAMRTDVKNTRVQMNKIAEKRNLMSQSTVSLRSGLQDSTLRVTEIEIHLLWRERSILRFKKHSLKGEDA